MAEDFLKRAYGARSPSETRVLYDDWSASYDAEVTKNGYATPGRAAAALAEVWDHRTSPILDFGCGTGLSGLAFRAQGFEIIDGMDISPEMLAKAKATKAYRDLMSIDPNAPPPIPLGEYLVITAIGVIGAGAAPISLFDKLMEVLPNTGRLVFSFNDHALEDPRNLAAVNRWTETGRATIEYENYGSHLPGIDLKSTVYIILKA